MKRIAFLAAFGLVSAASGHAQEAWVLPLSAVAPPAAPAASSIDILKDPVVEPGLKLLTDFNTAGLGSEASRLDAWRRGKSGIRLVEGGSGWRVSDASGASFSITPALGSALRNMNAYFSLTGPDAPDKLLPDLAAAFVTPAAAAQVRRAFERSMEERIVVAGKPYTVELGGSIALAPGGISLHYIDDLLRPTLRRMIAAGTDPAALRSLFAGEPKKMELLDRMGILKKHLERRAQWDAEGRIPVEKRDAMLRMAVDTVAESAAAHYSGDFGTQLQGMIADDWRGRDGGAWHCHPPDSGPGGWRGESPPSEADYEAAEKNGQETVVVFFADGFDVYFLSRGMPGMSAKPIASHRDPAWRTHFQSYFDRYGK